MTKFNYRQEARIITTETTEFTIEADTQEEADRIAASMTGYDLAEGDGVTLGNTGIDYNSNCLIQADQNGGRATLEIYRDDPEKLLFSNKLQ